MIPFTSTGGLFKQPAIKKNDMKRTNNINVEQLSFFGESSTQNHFHSEVWGMLVFYAAGSKEKHKCRHCLLCRSNEDCMKAPCEPSERQDGVSGYFSVMQMPTSKEG